MKKIIPVLLALIIGTLFLGQIVAARGFSSRIQSEKSNQVNEHAIENLDQKISFNNNKQNWYYLPELSMEEPKKEDPSTQKSVIELSDTEIYGGYKGKQIIHKSSSTNQVNSFSNQIYSISEPFILYNPLRKEFDATRGTLNVEFYTESGRLAYTSSTQFEHINLPNLRLMVYAYDKFVSALEELRNNPDVRHVRLLPIPPTIKSR